MTLPLSDDERLLKNVLDARGGSEPVLDSMNYFYNHRVRDIIESFRIETPDQSIGVFRNPFFSRPTITPLTMDMTPSALWPADARRNRLSYMGRLFADFELESPDGDVKTVKRVELGKMPAMIGSELCRTYSLTESERYARGEPAKDPRGYFIIKGGEKVLLNVEKLRSSVPLMYMQDKRVVVRYTSPELKESTINFLWETDFDVVFSFTRIGSSNLNVFYIFTILGITDIETALRLIEQYILDDDPVKQKRRRDEMRLFLKPTVNLFLAQTGSDITTTLNVVAGKIKDSRIKDATNRDQLIVELVRENVFKNIPYQGLNKNEKQASLGAKARLLASMIAKYTDFKNGHRTIDDRDNDSVKKLTDPGKHMATRFVQVWRTMMSGIQKNVTDKGITKAEGVTKEVSLNIMADMFIAAFNKELWGGTQVSKDVTVVDQLNRDNLVASLTQIRRRTKPAQRQGTLREKRLVHNSHYGFVCPVTASEGPACGLVTDAAVSTYVSLERDPDLVKSFLVLNENYVPDPTNDMINPLFFNGVPIGFCDAEPLRRYLVNLRRTNQQIPFDTGIMRDEYGMLWVWTTESRVCRPQLVVNESSQTLVIDDLNLRSADMDRLLDKGAIEYIDIVEQNLQTAYLLAPQRSVLEKEREERAIMRRQYDEVMNDPTATDEMRKSVDKAYQDMMARPPYTHCAIHPMEILGIGTTLMPFMEHNPAPRVTYQSSQVRQGLGRDAARFDLRFDTTARVMVEPGVPVVATSTHELLGLDEYPQGQEVIIAMTTYGGLNQEDAIIFNKDAVDRGMFNMVIYSGYTNLVCQTKNRQEKIMIPDNLSESKAPKYKHLDPATGLVRVGASVNAGDALIGKVAIDNTTGQERNETVFVEIGKRGVVEEVFETENAEACKLIRIRLRELRKIQAGDKFASRYSQKGTIGVVMPGEDMPWVVSDDPRMDGVRPHIIFNPHGIPSRMTTGKLYEILSGTIATETGERFNASAFERYDNRKVSQQLADLGFSPTGEYTMVNGITGREMDVQITVGPVYYQMLRHLVQDKMQARNTGLNDFYTFQPVQGIRRGGGLRFGEMERDSLIAYGAAEATRERMMFSSDEWNGVVCQTCGNFALENAGRGDIKCRLCNTNDFVRIKTPYVYKLLTQLLAAANIKLTLNTSLK